MANLLYAKAKEALWGAGINWGSNDIKAVLCDLTEYTIDSDNDEFLSDIPAAARVATSSNFASKTDTAGVIDAANITFSLVTGNECGAVVIYQDTGNAATSKLILYIDTATGLPVTPSGGNIGVEWDASGIAEL